MGGAGAERGTGILSLPSHMWVGCSTTVHTHRLSSSLDVGVSATIMQRSSMQQVYPWQELQAPVSRASLYRCLSCWGGIARCWPWPTQPAV